MEAISPKNRGPCSHAQHWESEFKTLTQRKSHWEDSPNVCTNPLTQVVLRYVSANLSRTPVLRSRWCADLTFDRSIRRKEWKCPHLRTSSIWNVDKCLFFPSLESGMESQGESGGFDALKTLTPVGIFFQKTLFHTFWISNLMTGGRGSSKWPENPTFSLYKYNKVLYIT